MATNSTLCAAAHSRITGVQCSDRFVVDQVDTQVLGIAPADVLVEGQHLRRALGQTIAAEQHIRVNVVRAEEVADATSPHIGGSLAPEALRWA